MDLSIATNFLNFLLTFNIILFLKQCFKLVLGPMVSKYEELSPISTVITLYNDVFKILLTTSGAVAHGVSLRKYRLSVANRVYEAECENMLKERPVKRIYPEELNTPLQSLSNLKIMTETWVPDPKTWPSDVAAREAGKEESKLRAFIELLNKFSSENKFDFWKGCLLYHMLGGSTIHSSYLIISLMCQTKHLVAYTRATLDIAEKLKAQDLSDVYALYVEEGEHKVAVAIYFLGSKLFGESNKTFDGFSSTSGDDAELQDIVGSVAHYHKLNRKALYNAVIQAAETYALCRKIPVEATYRATGLLYNPSSSPAFKSSSGKNWIQTGSSSDYKSRSIMIAVGADYSYKTSMAVIYGCMCIHYFAVILFGAGQVIGITILGANVWNPFDSSKSHSVRDILHNNMKYTIVLVVLLVINPSVPIIIKCFEHWRRFSEIIAKQLALNRSTVPLITKSSSKWQGILQSLTNFAENVVRLYFHGAQLPIWTQNILFTNHSDYVLNAHTPLTLSTYTGTSKNILTYSQKKQIGSLHKVRSELNAVYFLLNFFVIPFVLIRRLRLCTRLFGEVYTDC